MHDYMKALYRQFNTTPQSIQDLEQEVSHAHKQLSGKLEPPERKLLLRLVDLEDTLRYQSGLNSFTEGYCLAHGIHQELQTGRPPYNFEAEDERLARVRRNEPHIKSCIAINKEESSEEVSHHG